MTRVAIVGAGCAGLGAATALVKHGVDVVLIEASKRLGGRAWTSTDPAGLPIDMGPQFLQDPNVNPWKAIMEFLGFAYEQPSIGDRYRVQENGEWTDMYGHADITATSTLIEQGFADASKAPNQPPLATLTPAGGDARQYQALALGSNSYGSIAESAEPWQYIASDSARQNHPEDAGDNMYVTGGIGTLVSKYAERLCKDYVEHLTVVSETPIIGITSSAEVILKAEKKADIHADYCIVTVPVNQIASIAFDPPLAEPRTTALGLVKLGSYKKVAFRPTAIPAGLKPEIEYYAYDALTDGCWQYFRLPTDPSILICVTSGDLAARLDQLSDAEVTAAALHLLRRAYSTGDFTPQGDQVVVTNWSNQPFVNGAYSYTRYDPDRPADDAMPLQARIEIAAPHARVHFAGEATWTDGYGTIAGAYRSGQRAAEEILTAAGIAIDKDKLGFA